MRRSRRHLFQAIAAVVSALSVPRVMAASLPEASPPPPDNPDDVHVPAVIDRRRVTSWYEAQMGKQRTLRMDRVLESAFSFNGDKDTGMYKDATGLSFGVENGTIMKGRDLHTMAVSRLVIGDWSIEQKDDSSLHFTHPRSDAVILALYPPASTHQIWSEHVLSSEEYSDTWGKVRDVSPDGAPSG